MTNLVLSQILSLMTAFVAPDAAADGPGAGRHHRERGAGLCERLECTDAQRAKIDAIRAEHREELADERAEAKRLRAALKAERTAASPDPKKIASLEAELDGLKAAMKQARAETRTEISAVLTPEQRAQLAASKAERKGKGKAHRKGKGKGKGKGKAHAKAERDGKAHAKAKRGGKAGGKGKALAKRERVEARRLAG